MPKLLNDAQIEHFNTQGYVTPFRGISEEEACKCRGRIEAYEAQTGEQAEKRLKIKGHLAFPWIVELGCNGRVLDAVEDLIGPDILLFGTSIFAKNAHDPGFVSWHQDSAYFGLNPHDEVTAWIALTKSNGENGCLRVMPETHRGPDLQHVETYAANNMLARGQTIESLDESKAVNIELEPGQFSLHHERTAHGSLENRSDDRRIGLAFFYIPTSVSSTLGRGKALLVRGEDKYGHWDPDVLPRFDLDPVSLAELDRVWGGYKGGKYTQAAKAEA
ncbi:MAG: phytanoyl-CoA dioxygenase family protein, partial [Gammaproteobacteria bacterium]